MTDPRLQYRQEIQDCLESIDRKLQAQNPETDHEEEILLDLVDRHYMSEEEVLYPEMDHLMTPEEREAAVRAIEKIA